MGPPQISLNPLFPSTYDDSIFSDLVLAASIPDPIIPRMEAKPYNPEIPLGHPIKVYRNLRNKLWSIMDAKTRKVIGHTNHVWVSDVTFRVSSKGVQRIRETRRKQVVAFVVGKFQGYDYNRDIELRTQHPIRFNPYETYTFVDHHGHAVKIANTVNLTASGWVWAENPRVWPPYKA